MGTLARLGWLLMVLMAGLLPVASEGIAVKMDLGELVARSDLVVYGTVEEIHPQKHGREAVVRVRIALKGSVSANSRLRVSFSPRVSDSPTFAVAERVLLFLRHVDAENFQTVGGSQGKLSLD